MTKKTSSNKTQKNKKTSTVEDSKTVTPAKKTKTRGRPRKITNPEAPEQKKAKTVVSKKAGNKKIDSTPDKSKSVRRAKKTKVTPDSEVEIKVREIVKKTQSKGVHSEEKKESPIFNLDDVRAIIKKRKVEATATKKKADKKKLPSDPIKKEVKKKTKSTKVKKVQTASIDDILGFGGDFAPTRPIRDESKVPAEWKSYYKDLMSLRNSLKGALGQRSNETLGASAREASGELSINSSDSGTETFNRDVALSMVATEQEALEEIEDAIDRIFDGSFGICQETEKPIKKTRLKVVPFTRFSLEGQTLYEKRKRKKHDNGGGIFATISDSTMGQDD
jgi:RNA polymerase-binding transcription factor DksA